MHVTDYEGLRKLLIGTMTDAGLLVKTDEVLYLNELTRICELFIQRPIDRESTWAKVGFEWRAENQAALTFAHETDLIEAATHGLVDSRIMLHAAFHLHFDGLEVGADVIHEVTEALLGHARRYFGNDGSIVAELRLQSTQASIECLRYEIDVEAPTAGSLEWWQTWGAVCAGMLTQFDAIHEELYTRYGPTA